MIYFVQEGDGGLIKIGFSDNPQSRVAKMRVDCPRPINALAFVDGDKAEERRLHMRFAADRERGEWFRPSKDLLDHIATLAPLPNRTKRPTLVKDFAAAAGIGAPYASAILSGKRRLSWATAARVYAKTGRKFGPLVDADPETINLVERLVGGRKAG